MFYCVFRVISIFRPLLQHEPLKIRLKGLSYMNDDPHEIDVLYGRVQEEDATRGLLQQLADGLVDHFYKAGKFMMLFADYSLLIAKIKFFFKTQSLYILL